MRGVQVQEVVDIVIREPPQPDQMKQKHLLVRVVAQTHGEKVESLLEACSPEVFRQLTDVPWAINLASLQRLPRPSASAQRCHAHAPLMEVP